MTAEQFIRRNRNMYRRLAERKQRYAMETDDPLFRENCLAAAAVYRIAEDDMREILETAEDIRKEEEEI